MQDDTTNSQSLLGFIKVAESQVKKREFLDSQSLLGFIKVETRGKTKFFIKTLNPFWDLSLRLPQITEKNGVPLNPFWDLSREERRGKKRRTGNLSIPFGIYQPISKNLTTSTVITLNPFWDLSLFFSLFSYFLNMNSQSLLGFIHSNSVTWGKIKLSLSIPFGIYLAISVFNCSLLVRLNSQSLLGFIISRLQY